MQITHSINNITCFHCGAECGRDLVRYEDRSFCCEGCRSVYQLLQDKQLCEYYDFDKQPGNLPAVHHREKWAYLDNPEIARKLLQYKSEKLDIITIYIPGMHCTSCIYLLENLHKIARGVISAEVNFMKKELTIKYDPRETSLRQAVEILCGIGYTPTINMEAAEHKEDKRSSRKLTYQIGVAGFCFGNIMILSLPEYFDHADLLELQFLRTFRWLDLILILPVLIYCAQDYFRNAWYSIKTRVINMDLPIALGLSGLAIQSFYEVLSGTGGGYFDSMSGLIFFLLIGRYLQSRTYEALSFDRDYKSYFPLAALKVTNGKSENIPVNDLRKGDLILVHSEEIIPADSLLEDGDAQIDYAFVTGESTPVAAKLGELLYAGGRNKGPRLKMRVVQEVSQSYLTRLWNQKAFQKREQPGASRWANQLARYFIIAVLVIAAATALYWQMNDPSILMRAVTSVLIVACPCVLALTIPFTFGHVMRVLGRNGLYLKNAESVERLAEVDTLVFDKTGTLTKGGRVEVVSEGTPLSRYERQILSSLAGHSTHPISRSVREALDARDREFPIVNWAETLGQGISGTVDGNHVHIGRGSAITEGEDTCLTLNGKVRGHVRMAHVYRPDMPELITGLRENFGLYVFSGDNSKDWDTLIQYFKPENLYFRQGPDQKMQRVESLQAEGHKVLMIGDGLNDAGALKASNFGITITDDINSFTPAADAILDAKRLINLPGFVKMAQSTGRIIFGSFVFSLVYNCVGLSFAVTGNLRPWVAAVLMPISSITVVIYTHVRVRLAAKRAKLN